MDSFEKDFSRKVKEAFDNYNADHLVEAGWHSFQKKLEGKKRAGFVFPLWAKAATIGILLAIGSLITYRLTQVVDETPMAEATKVESEPGTVREEIEKAIEKPFPSEKKPLVQEPQMVNINQKQRAIKTLNNDLSDTSETVSVAVTEDYKSEHADTIMLTQAVSPRESVQEVSTDDDQDPIAVAIVEIEGDTERPLLPLLSRCWPRASSSQLVWGPLVGMYAVTKTVFPITQALPLSSMQIMNNKQPFYPTRACLGKTQFIAWSIFPQKPII